MTAYNTQARKNILSIIQGLKVSYPTDHAKVWREIKIRIRSQYPELYETFRPILDQKFCQGDIMAGLLVGSLIVVLKDPKIFLQQQGKWPGKNSRQQWGLMCQDSLRH